MSRRQHCAAGVLLAACFALPTGCSTDSSAGDEPSTPSVTSSSDTSGTPPTKTDPLEQYSTLEQQAYQEALGTYEQYLTVNTRLLRIGKATPAARLEYERLWFLNYRLIPGWQTLSGLDESNSYITGRYKVQRAEPTRIELSEKEGGAVSLRVCTEGSSRVFQRSRGEVDQPPDEGHKWVRVNVSRFPDGPWKMTQIRGTDQPC